MLELGPRHNSDESLARIIAEQCSNAREQLSRAERLRTAVGSAFRAAGEVGVTYGDIKLSFSASEDEGIEDISRPLFDATEVAVEKGRAGLLLLLDEAQTVRDDRDRRGDHPLSLLISAITALQRHYLPLGLVVCGLPTLTGNLLRARSYTERMFRGEPIGSLEDEEAREAFTKPLAASGRTAERDLVDKVISDVEGYPYFIQLWGAELWDAAEEADTERLTKALLEAVHSDIFRRLDIDFYEPRVSTLTPAEQDVLLSTADCPYPPIVVSDLNTVNDKSSGNINVLLERLVDAGVLYRLRKGQYEFTAPKFRASLDRRVKPPA